LLDKCKDLSFGNGVGGGNIATKVGWCCLEVMGISCRSSFPVMKEAKVLGLSQGTSIFVGKIILDDVPVLINVSYVNNKQAHN
jgi:hypothetical protein